MVYSIICINCKGIDQTISKKTADKVALRTELTNVPFTHVYNCSACLHNPDTDCGALYAWGKKIRKTKKKKNGKVA